MIAEGKGVVPYEKISTINSLLSKPEKDFYEHTEFYSSLKQSNVSFSEYENAKYLFKILKMRNLGDMNDLYNFQDVILLCEIIENRFQQMQETFGFNPRKINSASTLSGCVQRDVSKVITALPTNFEHAEIFEKSLIGGFSCVNTRVGFDTEVLLPSFTQSEYAKINIDQSFQNQNYKLGYKLKLDNDKIYKDYRVISKIIKFDENNQYGFAMTKPMPIGSIKDKEPSWKEFNLLMEKVSLDDPIGHLFVVDIEFDYENATPRQIMYNEVFPPIIEKVLEPNEKSIFQLLELYSEDNKGKAKSYKISPEFHATLLPKRYIPLYLEELKFVIYRFGWKVTNLYRHYHFEQERFKRDFILMSQNARQESKNSIESNFWKLLNKANFGYDRRNNLDSCTFEPINDELREITYIRRYYNSLFDREVAPFITSQVIKEEIDSRYNDQIAKISETDPFYSARVRNIENRRAAEEEALKSFREREERSKKGTILKSYGERVEDANKNDKIKKIIDFSDADTASIKSLGVKKNETVKITTRFIKGKMLVFSKVSLKAFVYDLIDIFCFLDDEVEEIYARNNVIRCFIYLILTNTDSCSIQFLFINNLKSSITEEKARDLIFDIIILKFGQRLDTSDDFYAKFLCQNKKIKKQLGLYEVESINNPNIVTLAVNPKEYFKVFRTREINKKHKGVKKTTPGMNFESFASRIMDIREYHDSEKAPKTIKQKRFQIKNTNMQMTTVSRT